MIKQIHAVLLRNVKLRERFLAFKSLQKTIPCKA